jgi:hypothetical protein
LISRKNRDGIGYKATRLISVNMGLPRVVMSNGEPVSTGIFKEPVVG